MSKLSPINMLAVKNSINFAPSSQSALLRNVVNKTKIEGAEQKMQAMELDDEVSTNTIPICNFKSNKLSHIDKKQRAE
jgi:hypothetical protein